ncbi:pentapeptide repeat-containing protein [Trichocoleus sp. FACHB-832]|uniref:pentapeptide repeat-containing protein n=1 Tax=Trichocoleus sp. FACHB-832 TaxID=2692875 RepID=UPI0016841843|nr:pentapeptide repeat-containing protein [Trichocoleus sp. FACHB-832]MBD1906762.1 pentapeptide repeat-containing protein [Trichocoleus sp. FACHB-832]
MNIHNKNIKGIRFEYIHRNEINFCRIRTGIKKSTKLIIVNILIIIILLNSVVPVFAGRLIASAVINSIEIQYKAFLISLGMSLVWIGITGVAFFISLMYILCGFLGETIAIIIYVLMAALLVDFSTNYILINKIVIGNIILNPKTVIKILNLIAAITVILRGAIIARQAVRGSPKFAWIREKAVFWAATGGTSFYGVDLTDACFDGANLPHTDFRKANLTRASFEEATGLDLARLQGTILEQPKVRKLLITKRGCNEDYTGSNFNGASLRRADLTGATLKEVNALDADFSGGILTDACIQGWNINKNTRFTNVVCERIYLKCSRNGNTITRWEQKPDSGKFKAGEFEKWISEIHETIDLIFREGLNWRAFIFSLAQTAIDHEGLDLSRYSISRKDEGIVFAEIGTFPGADKKAIHEAFTSCYESAVKAIEEKYQLVLQAKEGELERLKEFIESKHQIIRELMSIAVGTGRKVLIQGEGHRVYMLNQAGEIMETKNEGFSVGGNISIGGDNMSLTGTNLSLGELSGQVTNTIQQLQGVNAAGGNDLVKILTALQESIQGDSALSDNQKKDALEAVETIAEEAKKPPEDRVIKLCSMAVNALKGVASAVTDASKLAEVLKTYLPTLTGILGI